MAGSLAAELRDQIRGITGALLVVGLAFHYTMETWHLGWTLPMSYLLAYALVGIVGVVLIVRAIGFREEEQGGTDGRHPFRDVAVDAAEILLQSFVAAYGILLSFGIIDLGTSPNTVVRLGLVEVVPLGFGAALANRLFADEGEGAGSEEGAFPRNLAVFAVGALFVASPIAPTREIELVAVHMNWPRYAALIAVTLALIYLVLYELEFRGQHVRLRQTRRVQVGTVFLAYAVGAAVAFSLLLAFGHFRGADPSLVYRETVILSFPAALGAAAAEVVI